MKNQASTVEDEIRDTMAALLEEPAEKVEPQERVKQIYMVTQRL